MTKTKPPAPLNPKQELFVREYLADKDLNAKQAAIRAGYSPKTAEVQASRLLRQAKVRAYIEELQSPRFEKLDITIDRVTSELALQGFGKITDFYEPETGRMFEPHEMPPEVAARVSSIKVRREKTHATTDGVTEVSVKEQLVELKCWDKLSALQMLCRHLGMFRDKLEHSGEVSLLDALRRIQRREDEAKAAARQRRPA